MKLVCFNDGKVRAGLLVGDKIYGVSNLEKSFPDNIIDVLSLGEESLEQLRIIERSIQAQPEHFRPVEGATLMAPVPFPRSCRDGYAFRQHVATARRNRGLEMIKEFDQFPVFYFTNHNAIFGPGEVTLMPDHFQQLDFELEVAVVIGKSGRNIQASQADEYIAGYTIMNDLSARTLQMEEMLLSLGPAKGKDFATVIGPWLVTPEELEQFRCSTKPGHVGAQYDLSMTCLVNGEQVSAGNLREMDWTFAEIIERCSYGVELHPGDVIGSGTVGTGCFLELNGTAKLANPDYKPRWLKEGDELKLEVRGLGSLVNVIRAEKTDWSILNLKKTV